LVDVQFYWDSSFEASQDKATMILMFIDYIFKLLFKTFRNVNIDIDLIEPIIPLPVSSLPVSHLIDELIELYRAPFFRASSSYSIDNVTQHNAADAKSLELLKSLVSSQFSMIISFN